MKVLYSQIVSHITTHPTPSIEEISDKLFQLGHENEYHKGVFDIDITPNRGDCLSLLGLLRELSIFYAVNIRFKKYENAIPLFDIKFQNNSVENCPKISFLKIEIADNKIKDYSEPLKSYFDDLENKKNNFFTDISNYISFETGQPTHCYDSKALNGTINLEYIKDYDDEFKTLIDKKITLQGSNLVFMNNDKIINLAGIMGDKMTACTDDTKTAIVECAYFNPEVIIGKSIKYDIHSDASHKFERKVDINAQENVLRRFIQLVADHSEIKNIEFFSKTFQPETVTKIPLNVEIINKIIGINITENQYIHYLKKLGFEINGGLIYVPSHRNDIKTQNDLAEEVARVIGYDAIKASKFNIDVSRDKISSSKEFIIKNNLAQHGFYEVVNNPFVSFSSEQAVKVDNPLDTNRKFLRTSLKNSLIENLLYNERRQKDSVKLFEISDIYLLDKSGVIKKKKVLGVIASGRVDKNYKNFSKFIDNKFLLTILDGVFLKTNITVETISRDLLNSKLKNHISYAEIEIDEIKIKDQTFEFKPMDFNNVTKYELVSDFPLSKRDLSFSIKNFASAKILENTLLAYKNELLREQFIFDYYKNEIKNEIKIGFRFVFQSPYKTITDEEVNNVVDGIIKLSLKIDSVSIPGLKNGN